MVWSRFLQKIPGVGALYRDNYVTLKRGYFNLLRTTGIRPGPTVVHWLCTYRCNQRCVYCEASANDIRCNELTTDEIKRVLDDLGQLRVRRFFVTGGEPLVRRDLFEVLAYAKRRGMSVGMISNSTLYGKVRAEIRDVGFSSIWTSIDGLAETHDRNRGARDAFATTLEALRFYRECGIPLRVVNTLVHPGNLGELPELLQRLKDAGMTRWRLAFATAVGRASSADQWTLTDADAAKVLSYVEASRRSFDIELSEELGYLGCKDLATRNTPFICPSGISFCVIMPAGDVLPCQVVYDSRFSEGNVRERSIVDIWRSGFRTFRHPTLAGDCASCLHRRACNGGCWARLVNDEASCLRRVWDPGHYGHEHSPRIRTLPVFR